MKIFQRVWKFIKQDIAFVGLAILLCMQVDWEWTNIKSFLTGGVIFASAILKILGRFDK